MQVYARGALLLNGLRKVAEVTAEQLHLSDSSMIVDALVSDPWYAIHVPCDRSCLVLLTYLRAWM